MCDAPSSRVYQQNTMKPQDCGILGHPNEKLTDPRKKNVIKSSTIRHNEDSTCN